MLGPLELMDFLIFKAESVVSDALRDTNIYNVCLITITVILSEDISPT